MPNGGLKVGLVYLRLENRKSITLEEHQSIKIHPNICVLFPHKQETQQQDVPDLGDPV